MSMIEKQFGVAGDPFGQIAASYRDFRPTYPKELIEHLSHLAPDRERAWDCATGTGQVAIELASHFKRVLATDISPEQIAAAKPAPGVDFQSCPAERSGIEDRTIALITVAQALHWFKTDEFFLEAKRVLVPQGVLAIWTYGPLVVEGQAANDIVQNFYHTVVGPYWPEGRQHVDSGYATIAMPYSTIFNLPSFEMTREWQLPDLMGYISTWSAVINYKKENLQDPLPQLGEQLGKVWSGGEKRKISWPLTIRAGRFD